MRPIARFQHLMSSTVEIAQQSGRDANGEATFGADASYPAHISGKRRMVRNALGQEVVSSQALYLGASVAVQPTDRVTLSTGDVGSTESVSRQPAILAVERRSDGYGPHHVVVYLA